MALDSPIVLKHAAGEVRIERRADAPARVAVTLADAERFMPRPVIETRYPTELIEKILEVKGLAALGDEIARDEDPSYVESSLLLDLLAFRPPEWFAGKRILDFGCGSGASTMILARRFPASEIVGIELEERLLAIARLRARFYGFDNVRLLRSPSGVELPAEIGAVDCLVLSAVFEHLLPDERRLLLPKLWSLLPAGGVLFLDQTPHRWFPIEPHTTYLPLINYLPDRIAHVYARRCSRLIDAKVTWPQLLRGGVRGGSEGEILALLRKAGSGDPALLTPDREGVADRIDLWHAGGTFHSYPRGRRLVRDVAKAVKRLTGVEIVPYLSIAVEKTARRDLSPTACAAAGA
ncbi:class I SAM-dependent methyltransferase [Methylosinus sp. Sm6]|uniref:class I SAM-dependent methyltransferase n=1 Tax=Methylosinus sp. Sm6 TaxID=2866948 RepID=UPI001C99918F|nr:methyltransferase [Methylosinus sp. Sm6]MBY6241374.1 methyltransferase domain-containing protein [Methylosinus sp. Sm6]